MIGHLIFIRLFPLFFQTEEACNLIVPTIQISKVLKNKPPWINQNLKSLIRDKNLFRYKNCSCEWKDEALRRKNIFLCKRVRTEIKITRVKYEIELVKRAEKNQKILYKYLNRQ